MFPLQLSCGRIVLKPVKAQQHGWPNNMEQWLLRILHIHSVIYNYNTVKSFIFVGHLNSCISWVGQSTEVASPNGKQCQAVAPYTLHCFSNLQQSKVHRRSINY